MIHNISHILIGNTINKSRVCSFANGQRMTVTRWIDHRQLMMKKMIDFPRAVQGRQAEGSCSLQCMKYRLCFLGWNMQHNC